MRNRVVGETSFSRLWGQKITIPDRVTDYVHRVELVDRAMPHRRRLTVLRAAAGFGKTTLLAECTRRLSQQGIPVAYVSVDENETPASLDTYVAFACDAAGLTVEMAVRQETPIAAAPRVGAVTRSIQTLGSPFCIAIDGLELLAPEAVAILEFLLQRGPPNLHLAFAGRQIPDGLNVASAVLDGSAEVIGTEDLRFSRPEVARFFGLELSRRALAREMDRTAGWPFALRISRCDFLNGGERHGSMEGIAGNWIESRLFPQLTPDDRAFVLDQGLFDWIDETLLDEVLGPGKGSMRLGVMPVVEGLLKRVTTDAGKRWQLHVLLRNHCAAQRLREDPTRFGLIHLRIADALARRAETVAAMRHAVHGGDALLAGDILLRAGGVRFWLRQGVPQYQEADRLLTAEAIARSRRLKLVRCVALMLSGKQKEARAVYAESSPSEPAEGFEHRVDDCIVRAAMGVYGGEHLGSGWRRHLLADCARFARSPRLNAATSGYLEYALSVLHFLNGELDPALERLALARKLSPDNRQIEFYGEVLRGQLDFVRGRARDAESSYRRARRLGRKFFMLDPVAATACLVALDEYELECNRPASVEQRGVWWVLNNRGVPFSYFATAANVLIDRRLRARRTEEAIAATDKLLVRVRADGRVASVRLLAALRTTVLVVAGRVEDAERFWGRENLPEHNAACVDVTTQSMREMEAVSEARARLLIAERRYEEARGLLSTLETVAATRSWRKTQMRAVALSILLEHAAGAPAAGVRRLTEYLELYGESPYAWPLLREPAVCPHVLSEFLRLEAHSPHCASARSLLAAARAAQDSPELSLSDREREILGLLAGRRIKHVAATLGLSVHGVRYHLRKLFSKLGVSTRAELLRRAGEMGLVPRQP